MTQIKKIKLRDFDEELAKELKDPEFKRMFDEYGRQLELSYALLQLRKKKKMSQAVLAKKVGTTQSNIARVEGGQQNFSVAFLGKIAAALDAKMEIKFL